MSWKDLLETDEPVRLPWLGDKKLRSSSRSWGINRVPIEHGWFAFRVSARSAAVLEHTLPLPELLGFEVKGYLVGDHVVRDGARVDPDPNKIKSCAERVHLLEDGLDRFARVCAGRIYQNGPLVFKRIEMPLGPEDPVLQAFLDKETTVDGIRDVAPALDLAFRLETYQREQSEKRRLLLEQKRREEEAKRALEARRQELTKKLGDGAGRRELAHYDFESAARAALLVGGAEYLDSKLIRKGEYAVKYRLDGRRFECICDLDLHIQDSGICLTSHETGEKGDTLFTLESLPSVIQQAIREDKLVVYRHV